MDRLAWLAAGSWVALSLACAGSVQMDNMAADNPGALTERDPADAPATAEARPPVDLRCLPAGLPTPPLPQGGGPEQHCAPPPPPLGDYGMGPPPEQDGPPPGPLPVGVGPEIWHVLGRVYDNDESRSLDPSERDELARDLAARCAFRQARFLADFDRNADGTLSPEELQAALPSLRAQDQQRHPLELRAFDANHDGQLDCLEWRAAMDARRARAQQQQHADEAQADADHSGALDSAERAALRASLKDRIRHGLLPGEFPPPGAPPP